MSYPYIPLEIDMEIDDNTENVPLDIGEAFFVYENDYNKLENKPSINGEELVGDIEITDLFDIDAEPTEGSENAVSSGGVYDALQGKQDTLIIDAQPVEDSGNPISSGGVYDALQGKQDTLTIDAAPTLDSTNPVQSGGTAAALALKAPLASPDFTGNPTAPTQSSGDSSTKIATTAFAHNAIERALKIMHASQPIELTGNWNQIMYLPTGFYVVTNNTYATDYDNRITVPDGSNFLYVERDVNDFLPAYSSLTVFIDPLTRTPYGAYDPEMGEAYNDLDPATYASIMDDAYAALSTFAGIPQIDAAPTSGSMKPVSSGGVYTALAAKQDTLTIDTAPVEDSGNPISSGAVYTALEDKQDTLTIDATPTVGSVNPVQSGGTASALALKAPLASPAFTDNPTAPTPTSGDNSTRIATTAFVEGEIARTVSGVYRPAGSIAFAQLPALTAAHVGEVYDITDAFVTTADFVEGAGISYPAGTDVAIVEPSEGVYKYDAMSGMVDLSNYYTDAEVDTLLAGKENALTFDNVPQENSDNPVKSGGIYDAIAVKQDALTFDSAPTNGSDNPVKSGGVYTALQGKQATLTFDNVPTDGSNNPVKSDGIYDALALKAPLASPALTGEPTAPTATAGTNTTQIATTAFVQTAISGKQDALPVPTAVDNGKFLRVVNGAYALATVPEAAGEEF